MSSIDTLAAAPTSARFMELLRTFRSLTERKQKAIEMLRSRYQTGVDKLEFAQSQINVMQAELQRLRPELIRT
uniref:Uncharacterized protein n=1 Tax=Plectus sambesii TaxID=2011161 RepID=A0A914VRI9_9BILA